MPKTVCVVLPTFNEAQNVRVLVPRLFEQASGIPSHEVHVLVVDDESPDGTGQEVTALMERFPRLHLLTGRKSGLGAAYQRGIRFALEELKPDLIVQMDADLQHDPSLLPLFVTLANHGFTLVIGSRFAPGGSTPDFSLRRRLLSRAGNWMIRFVGGLPRIHDCTSGYRCIATPLLARCDLSHLSTRGYSFLSSLLCELLRNGARPIEVPITFGSRGSGESKLALRDQVEFLANVARIRFRYSHEFLRWALTGGCAAAVNMAGYWAFTRHAGLSLELASPLAIELSLLTHFALGEPFRARKHGTSHGFVPRLLRSHFIRLPAAGTNFIVLALLARLMGFDDLVSNVAAIACGIPVNWYANTLSAWTEVEVVRPGNESRGISCR